MKMRQEILLKEELFQSSVTKCPTETGKYLSNKEREERQLTCKDFIYGEITAFQPLYQVFQKVWITTR